MPEAPPSIDASKAKTGDGEAFDTARAEKEAADLKNLIDSKKEAMATPSKEPEEKKEEELTDEEKKAKEEAEAAAKKAEAEAKAKTHEEEQLAAVTEKFGESMSVEAVYEKIKARQDEASDEKPLTSDEFDNSVERLTSLYQARMWPHALESAIDAVAVLEALPPEQLKKRTGFMGTLDTDKVVVRHNLAAVLHQVGYYDTATHFYTEAKSGMTAWKDTNCFTKCCDSQLKTQRLDFINQMITLVGEKKKPPSGEYLGEDGEKGEWKADELDEAITKVKTDIFHEKAEGEEEAEAEAPAAAPASAPASAPAAATANGNGAAVKAS